MRNACDVWQWGHLVCLFVVCGDEYILQRKKLIRGHFCVGVIQARMPAEINVSKCESTVWGNDFLDLRTLPKLIDILLEASWNTMHSKYLFKLRFVQSLFQSVKPDFTYIIDVISDIPESEGDVTRLEEPKTLHQSKRKERRYQKRYNNLQS